MVSGLAVSVFNLYLHLLDLKGRNASQTVPGRKKRDAEGNNNDAVSDAKEVGENARALAGAEKDELTRLREQVSELQTKLSEKEEVLKSVEISKKNQLNEMQMKLEETRRLVAERDTLIKSMQLQLSDTKVHPLTPFCGGIRVCLKINLYYHIPSSNANRLFLLFSLDQTCRQASGS